jgi:hypothetical protein
MGLSYAFKSHWLSGFQSDIASSCGTNIHQKFIKTSFLRIFLIYLQKTYQMTLPLKGEIKRPHKTTEKSCQVCGIRFLAKNSMAKYCSHNCRNDVYFAKKAKQKSEEITEKVLEIKQIAEAINVLKTLKTLSTPKEIKEVKIDVSIQDLYLKLKSHQTWLETQVNNNSK